jgi:dihydropteroate synthase
MRRPPVTLAGRHRLAWGERTLVMGILNVTADSFSGDGLLAPGRDPDRVVAAALDQARQFVAAGADLLDVGAESTRPAAVYGEHAPVPAGREAALAVPVVRALAEAFPDVPVSIDTSKGEVAEAALAAGASIVNDVWAGSRDPGTVRAAAATGAAMVLMHNAERAEYPRGVVATIIARLREAAAAAAAAGMGPERLLVDPGIGFGKTSSMNLEILRRLGELRVLGLPILIGTSRKRFIGDLLGGAPPERRLEGTAASVALAIANGADAVRVHDVEPMARVARVADGIVRSGRARFGEDGDRIRLIGLRFEAPHGVLAAERDAAQRWEVDVELTADAASAAAADVLSATVDYALVYEAARDVVEGEPVQLVETLAERIAARVLERLGVDAVTVRVRKPDAPLPGPFATVEVEVRRRR